MGKSRKREGKLLFVWCVREGGGGGGHGLLFDRGVSRLGATFRFLSQVESSDRDPYLASRFTDSNEKCSLICYCMSKKSCLNAYSILLHKMRQDFLGIQYLINKHESSNF